MEEKQILSKLMTLIYLFNEFGNVNLEVTTVLDKEGCWTGKVILEQTTQPAVDDLQMADFYTKVICEKLKNGVDN